MKRTERMIVRAIRLGLVFAVCTYTFCPISEAGTFVGTTDDEKTAIAINIDTTKSNVEAIAQGEDAIAIGRKAIAEDGKSIAIGCRSNAQANAVAVGSGTTAKGYYSTAIGGAYVKGDWGVGIGDGAIADNFGVALGTNSAASNEYDVALGAYSTTKKANTVSGTTIGGKHYNFATGNEVIAAVSLGVEYEEADAVYTRQLQYLAPGELSATSTDGVNGSQLYATNCAIDSLGGRVDRVGAGAAALAALHPLDYDRDNKFSMAASVGNYRGTQATALGAFYRPNETVMLSLAGSAGGGENMASLGVSFAVGKGVGPYRSKQDMAQTIETLQAENQSLRDKMNEQDQKLAELTRKVDALMAQNNH